MAEKEPKRIQAPDDGSVIVTSHPDVTEQEIVEDRENIIQQLDAAYLNLKDQMVEFQAQWDENPALAFIAASREGVNQGGAEWLQDQVEIFEAQTWIDLGGKVKDFAGTSYDRTATYSKEVWGRLQRNINKHIDNPEDTLYNWAWWQAGISAKADEMARREYEKLERVKQVIEESGRTVLNTADKATKMFKHRNAILGLPSLIAGGDPKPVQAFVDTVLMDIDPELAKAIKTDPNFHLVLELIADHDSILSYLAYVGLMFEAVPPNFYAYSAGKGAAYLMIEIVLLVVTAVLSAGAAAAARITMLVARFAATSVKVAQASRKLKRAEAAISAFIRVIEDFSDVADRLHAFAVKLRKARSKGLQLKGSTRTSITAKRQSIKRDKRCRMCGSTEHSTPRHRMGTVVYK